jgi:hypothetical protein
LEFAIKDFKKIIHRITILNWVQAFKAELKPSEDPESPFIPESLFIPCLAFNHRQRGVWVHLVRIGMVKAKDTGVFECEKADLNTGRASFRECLTAYRDAGLIEFTETEVSPIKKVLQVEPIPSETTLKKDGRVWIVRRTNKPAKEQTPGIAS